MHDTDEEMRQAYRRTTFFSPKEDDDFTAGRVCPVRDLADDGTWGARVGYILLARNYCSTLVVSHEIVHAAMEIYRSLPGKARAANFGKSCSPKEEELAHIYDELFTKMTRKLHKLGVWD